MIIEINGVELEIGKDIIILSAPEPIEDGWRYSIKAISHKAWEVINDLYRQS